MGSVFGKITGETPKYDVVDKGDFFEIRKYGPCLVAETTYEGGHFQVLILSLRLQDACVRRSLLLVAIGTCFIATALLCGIPADNSCRTSARFIFHDTYAYTPCFVESSGPYVLVCDQHH